MHNYPFSAPVYSCSESQGVGVYPRNTFQLPHNFLSQKQIVKPLNTKEYELYVGRPRQYLLNVMNQIYFCIVAAGTVGFSSSSEFRT